MFEFPTNGSDFVVWLGVPGVVGVIIAILLERNAKFKTWKSPWKGRLVLALFLVFPFFARLASWGYASLTATNPVLLAQIEGVLEALIGGLIAYGASQYAHDSDPQKYNS